MKSCLSPAFFVLFGLLIMLAGAGGAWQMTSDWFQSRASCDWPQTRGVIVWRNALPRKGGRRGVYSGYDFDVRYNYEVKGKTYLGTRYDWNATAKSKDQTGHLLVAYPPNSRVSVSYDPNHPAQSCLVPDSFNPNSIYSSLFFSLIFCFGLFCLFLGALPQRARWKSTP